MIAQLANRTGIPCQVLAEQDPKWTLTQVEVFRVEAEQAERARRGR